MERVSKSVWIQLAIVIALAAGVFWPGVRGGFLFDDYPNLEPLGRYGHVDSWPALARYVTAGQADPTGRPLAVATFLLDARTWPADPYPFKRTNIFLHLLNGLLLFGALSRLGRAWKLAEPAIGRAALVATSLWLLHPLLLSTVLYIVQREAMLPATFTFAALWAWLACRQRILAGHHRSAWLLWALVPTCTVLATLSKANGALLPPLLLVVESSLSRIEDAPVLRRARQWLLWLPSLLLAASLLAAIPGFVAGTPAIRGWTLGQRLLTEPRVLFDYLGLIWLPRSISPGLFNDDFGISVGMFQPWTTLPALAGVVALVALAWCGRRRWPAVTLAVGFYLVGQSIESGPVPLEIYFEHRNYLPMAMMFWPVAVWLADARSPRPWLRTGLSVLLPLLLATLTWVGAGVWGDSSQQALVWSQRNPDSPRAQAYAAQLEARQGHDQLAEQRLRHSLREHPVEVQLIANLIGVRCQVGSVSAADLATATRAFATAPDPTRLAFKWMQTMLPVAQTGTCKGFDLAAAKVLAQAFADNRQTSASSGRRSDAEHLLGEVALADHHPEQALAHFDAAYRAQPKLDTVLVQAAMLASAKQPAMALAHLRLASISRAPPWYQWRSMGDIHNWVLYHQGFWQQQIDELRGKIRKDLRYRP